MDTVGALSILKHERGRVGTHTTANQNSIHIPPALIQYVPPWYSGMDASILIPFPTRSWLGWPQSAIIDLLQIPTNFHPLRNSVSCCWSVRELWLNTNSPITTSHHDKNDQQCNLKLPRGVLVVLTGIQGVRAMDRCMDGWMVTGDRI